MALGKNLEDLLKHMSPETAAAQRKFWEDNPAIADVVEKMAVPQAEFNRQLNLKDEEVKKHKKTAEDWEKWGKDNKPKHERLLTEHEELQKNYKILQDKVKESAGGGSGEGAVSVEELETKVLERVAGKTVSEERLGQIIAEETKKLKDDLNATLDTARKDFFEKTLPMATAFQTEMVEAQQDYREEFGKKLDRKDFSDFMTENRIVSPREALERFVAKDREEKRIKTEVEKRLNDELSKRNVPGVSSTSGPADVGPLQLKIAGETPKFAEGTELGDLSAAAMAAKELRSEEKAA